MLKVVSEEYDLVDCVKPTEEVKNAPWKDATKGPTMAIFASDTAVGSAVRPTGVPTSHNQEGCARHMAAERGVKQRDVPNRLKVEDFVGHTAEGSVVRQRDVQKVLNVVIFVLHMADFGIVICPTVPVLIEAEDIVMFIDKIICVWRTDVKN